MRGTLPVWLKGAAAAAAGWLIAPPPTATGREPCGRDARSAWDRGFGQLVQPRSASAATGEPDPDLDDLPDAPWGADFPEGSQQGPHAAAALGTAPCAPDPDFGHPAEARPSAVLRREAGHHFVSPAQAGRSTPQASKVFDLAERPRAGWSEERRSPPPNLNSPVAKAPPRPVVAVVGLASRAGATTVARALAVALAVRDPGGTAAVCGGVAARRAPLRHAPAALRSSGPAGRLARVLAGLVPAPVASIGRLCLVPDTGERRRATIDSIRGLAPLVIDAGGDLSPDEAASLADHVILVAGRSVEPALLDAVAATLADSPARTRGVADRVEVARWSGRDVLLLPADRASAAAARGGRKGRLSERLAPLADSCLVRS